MRKKNPYLLALANPHAHKPARTQTPLNSVPGVWGFRDVIVTIRLSDWSICTTWHQYSILIGPRYTGAILLLTAINGFVKRYLVHINSNSIVWTTKIASPKMQRRHLRKLVVRLGNRLEPVNAWNLREDVIDICLHLFGPNTVDWKEKMKLT